MRLRCTLKNCPHQADPIARLKASSLETACQVVHRKVKGSVHTSSFWQAEKKSSVCLARSPTVDSPSGRIIGLVPAEWVLLEIGVTGRRQCTISTTGLMGLSTSACTSIQPYPRRLPER